MIVLFNVKITDIRMGYPYRRAAWMPNPERYDVFRYCLASTAVLDAAAAAAIFRSLRAGGTKSQRCRKRRRPAAQLPPHCTQQGVRASASRQWRLALTRSTSDLVGIADFALHRRRELATDVHLRRGWGDPMQLGASKRLGNTHG